MTDEHDSTDPGLTPAQEAEVRRLLADARHAEPTPEAVVARLDRVLADLATEPAREATVTRLADRRRRAGTMLVAAAAVVVAGVGISKVVDDGPLMSGAADETAAGAPEAATAEEEPEAEGARPELDSGSVGGADADLYADYADRERPFKVQSDDFARDARELRMPLAYAASEQSDGVTNGLRNGVARDESNSQVVCEQGDWGSGVYISVLYDDAPGWVVLRPEQGSTQVADLFLCGSEVATRSVTLPVR